MKIALFVVLLVAICAGGYFYLNHGASLKNAGPAKTDVQSDIAAKRAEQGTRAVVPENAPPPAEMQKILQRAEDEQRGQKMMMSILGSLSSKNIHVDLSRNYPSVEECDKFLKIQMDSYKQRNLEPVPVPNGEALLGMPATVYSVKDGADFNYLSCVTDQTKGWAGYVQFKLPAQPSAP